ncbi:MAG: ABC transporter permease [Clostridia bacterium]|nr:ABC transporter permease [Clostridia bacterium]
MTLEIIKKEFLKIIRDKRSLLSIFLPLVIFPLIFSFVGLQAEQSQETLNENVLIFSNVDEEFLKDFLPNLNFSLVDCDNPEKYLVEEKIYAIVNFENLDITQMPISVNVVYNANSNLSIETYSKIMIELDTVNGIIINQNLIDAGVNPDVLNGISINSKTIETNTLFVMLAPLLIVSLLVSGGANVSADIFAGEKERGLLERTIVTQVNKNSLLYGKMAVVFTMTILSATISTLAYALSIAINPSISKMFGSTSTSLNLEVTSYIQLVTIILTFCAFISSVLITISILSKNAKEASSHMSILTMLPSIISLLVTFASFGINKWAYVVPFYGAIAGLKLIFLNAFEWSNYLLLLISQIVLCGLFTYINQKLIEGNKFLL